MIPDAAVEAAEAVLLGYTGGCACHEGYSGRNLIDPECSYHDVPPEVARLILEAAAPHMLAGVTALADGWEARGEHDMAYSKTIPDEDIAMEILTNGAQMVENARHIRNAIGGAK